MSVPLILQVLGWVAVLWLITVQVLIRRERVPQDGPAFRIAGCVAAAAVVAASVAAGTWPVAALGLLWLRTEVFGHRYPVRADDPEPEELDGEPSVEEPPAQVGTRTRVHLPVRRRSGLRVHLLHWGPRAVNVLFEIEIAVVLVIAIVLFGIWAQQERDGFGQRANSSLCSFFSGGC